MTREGRDSGNRLRLIGTVFAAVCVVVNAVAAPYELGLYASSELRAGRASTDSFWNGGGESTLLDANGILRPLFSAEHEDFKFTAELDAIFQIGDSLGRLNGVGSVPPVFARTAENEFFDLTRVWSEGVRHRHTLRMDRFAVSWRPDWGTVTAGRQAVTWGGGLVFNPFDLFNPFAPNDVVRDYKAGADMLLVDVPTTNGGFQFLSVARRDEIDNRVAADASSFALQYKFFFGRNEGALFVASHYGEPALGAGLGGSLGSAAWRVDGTWQRVQPAVGGAIEDYASLVANLQYSWVWGGRNVFGFVEYYFNGLGESDYFAAALDPFVQTQIRRGSLFVLGRHYTAASLQIEMHPLVNVFLSGIVNLEDPSAVLQPRVAWNASQTLTLTAGFDLPVGKTGSEFGGVEIPGTGLTTRSPASGYCRATWFF